MKALSGLAARFDGRAEGYGRHGRRATSLKTWAVPLSAPNVTVHQVLPALIREIQRDKLPHMSSTQDVTVEVTMPSIEVMTDSVALSFGRAMAEAQLAEHALKAAITDDVQAFAGAGDKVSFLEILEKVTFGQAKNIAIGTASQKEIAACVGFYDFVKMQWHFSGRPESELAAMLKDAVDRRNRIAHGLLAEVIHGRIHENDALTFLEESRIRLFDLRTLITMADVLSSKMGSVASDGSSLPRFKTTR
jgi:hypothetical protein